MERSDKIIIKKKEDEVESSENLFEKKAIGLGFQGKKEEISEVSTPPAEIYKPPSAEIYRGPADLIKENKKMVEPIRNEWVIQMASTGIDMFFLRWACTLVNIASLGIAVPWTTTWYWNAWTTRVRIDSKRIIFNGSPGGFFVVWMKVWILTILTLTIYYWIEGHKAQERYIDGNIDWASNH